MTDLRSNRYLLSPERSAELIKECLDRVDDVRSGLGVLELDGSDDVSDIARVLEREVFDQAFGDKIAHTPDFMTYEYGPYEDRSTFFLVLDIENSVPVGTLRITKGLPNKTTRDLAAVDLLDPQLLDAWGFEPERTWDITSLVVTPVTRATKARNTTLILFRVLYAASIAENIKHWTTIIDNDVAKTCAALGMPFRRVEEVGSLNYLGTDGCMYVAEVDEVRPSMTSHAELTGPRVARRVHAMLDGADFLPEIKPHMVVVPEARTTDSDNSTVLT